MIHPLDINLVMKAVRLVKEHSASFAWAAPFFTSNIESINMNPCFFGIIPAKPGIHPAINLRSRTPPRTVKSWFPINKKSWRPVMKLDLSRMIIFLFELLSLAKEVMAERIHYKRETKDK